MYDPSALDPTLTKTPIPAASRKAPSLGSPKSPIWFVFPAVDWKAFQAGTPLESTFNYRLEQVMAQAGMRVNDCYFCVLDDQPASDYYIARSCPVPQEVMETFHQKVSIYRPKLLVAVGEPALAALTAERGIDKWRGSFLPLEGDFPRGSPPLVLPILDAWRFGIANVELSFVTQIDLKKIALRLSGGWAEPRRDYKIDPTFSEACDYLLYLRDEAARFACDIETPQKVLGCIGFSDTPYQAFVIPFLRWGEPGQHAWASEQEVVLWRLLAQVLGNPRSEKVFQNAMFDQTFLWDRCQIMTRGRTWDTMVMHHLLYPDFPKSLGFLTSLYTLDPFYKDEGKIEDKEAGDNWQYWTYNAKDCDVTLRIFHTLMSRLERHGHAKINKHLSDLHTPIFQMSIRGIRVDNDLRQQQAAELRVEQDAIHRCLERLIGHQINLSSPDQVQAWLYTENGLEPEKKERKNQRTKERTFTDTSDADAIRSLVQKLRNETWVKGGEKDRWRRYLIAQMTLVLRHGELKDRLKFLTCPISPDGRFRSTFNIAGAVTGRFASKQYTLDGSGGNLQNKPKRDRIFMVPDLPEETVL